MDEQTRDVGAGNRTVHMPARMSGIVLLFAVLLSFVSVLVALVFLSMGAWITSIPFVLSTVFGIYFLYLQWHSKELEESEV